MIIRYQKAWIGVLILALIGTAGGYYFGRQVGSEPYEALMAVVKAQKVLLEEKAKATVLPSPSAPDKANEEKLLQQFVADLQAAHQSKKQLELQLSALSSRYKQLEEKLQYYQETLKTPAIEAGVQLMGMRWEKAALPRNFRFSFMLAQSAMEDKERHGKIRFALEGEQDGLPSLLEFENLNTHKPSALHFSFFRFQEVTGEFELPLGFVPHRLHLRLVPDSPTALDMEYSYNWDDLEFMELFAPHA